MYNVHVYVQWTQIVITDWADLSSPFYIFNSQLGKEKLYVDLSLNGIEGISSDLESYSAWYM